MFFEYQLLSCFDRNGHRDSSYAQPAADNRAECAEAKRIDIKQQQQ